MSSRFELSRHGDSANVRPMEGLRGFAVFLVFLVHYATLMAPWMASHSAFAQTWEVIHTVGYAGVDLFFVLSGYLIYGSLIARRQPYLSFMGRRIARIYPAFLAVFALYLALSLLRPAESKIPAGIMPALTYVLQNVLLLPGVFPIEPMITVAWSLSYEMLYYVALPLVILAFGLRAKSSTWRCWFFAAAGVALLFAMAPRGGLIRLAMFVAGILLYEAMRAKRSAAPAWLAAALAIAGILFTAVPMPLGTTAPIVKTLGLFIGFYALCHSCFSAPHSWLARGFSLTPLRWLGNMSYSYYLLHGLVLKVVLMVLTALMAKLPIVSNEAAFVLGMLPLVFAVSLLPTAALFLLIERPFSLAAAPRPALKGEVAT